jgi:hypothetical protein
MSSRVGSIATALWLLQAAVRCALRIPARRTTLVEPIVAPRAG